MVGKEFIAATGWRHDRPIRVRVDKVSKSGNVAWITILEGKNNGKSSRINTESLMPIKDVRNG